MQTPRRTNILVCALVGLASLGYSQISTHADILTTGDLNPLYPAANPDPWILGLDNLRVGDTGTGTLNIDAGSVISNYTSFLGHNTSSLGTATVTGSGSQWNTNQFYVGRFGTGSLNIQAGGIVSNSASYLGAYTGSIGATTVTGTGSTWNNSNALSVGFSGTGTLNIQAGGVVSSSTGYLGRNAGSTGTTTVTGAGSQWNNSNMLFVGRSSTGTLNIEAGGVVDVASDTYLGFDVIDSSAINFNNGTLNTGGLLASPGELLGVGIINTKGLVSDVDLVFDATHGLQQTLSLNSLPGQNITLNLDASAPAINGSLGAGYRGAGTLTITDGLAVSSTKGYLGYHAGSTGTATINGTGSRWEHIAVLDVLTVGRSGNGTLNIENGGSVSLLSFRSDASLGFYDYSTGTVTVTDPGSTLTLSYSLDVGRSGTGTLNIENGGSVSFNFIFGQTYLGRDAGSNGTVTVSGTDSTLTNPKNLNVGFSGAGTLNITNGGMVSIGGGIGGDMTLGQHSSSAGTVNLSGGTLNLNGNDIDRGSGSAAFNFTGGTIMGAAMIDVGSTFLQQGGTIAPGVSIGQTDIIGDYDLTAGTIEIEVGGVGDTADLLTATGDIDIAFLGTTLDLPALGVMAAGTYTVLESLGGTITGEFENITGIGIYAGLVDVQHTTNAVTITLNWDFVPGDLNGDGFVGIDDMTIVLSNWNQNVATADLSAGDTSGDGFIGIADLSTVLGNWNTGTPPPAEVLAMVPEPGTVGLLAVGMLWGCGRRGQRRA